MYLLMNMNVMGQKKPSEPSLNTKKYFNCLYNFFGLYISCYKIILYILIIKIWVL